MEARDRGRGTGAADSQFVLFVLDEQRYAVPLRQVERIVRAVEVRPLPEAPAFLHGVVNVQGRALPVVDMRRRFGLDQRPIEVSDHFVIADGRDGAMILPVDAALGSRELVAERPDRDGEDGHAGDDAAGRDVAADVMRLAPDCVKQVFTDAEGMVFVLDIDHILTVGSGAGGDGTGLRTVEIW